ncbi:MAG: hypothetical protein V2A34_05035 [Lentisphaerota bacterium]
MKKCILFLLTASLGSAWASDLSLVTANMGRRTSVPNGEVTLTPQVTITPPRRTVMGGDTVVLKAKATNTSAFTWFIIENKSGCSLATVNATSVTYQAGTTSSVIDIVEAWDGTNKFGRAYFNIISASEVAQAGKAIILSGRKNKSDSVWPTTDFLAHSAYNVLRYRGYSKDNINYLSPDPNEDVDGDGLQNDIDAENSLANVGYAFTNWANNANKLFVYLVDHGGDAAGSGYFRLNENESLTATNLDVWLDRLQNTYHTEITVLIDCCFAGSLLDDLSYTGAYKRVVVASCSTNEGTRFLAGGLVSFSDAFFSGIMLGYDLDRSWQQARDAMSTYQAGMYYENTNGASSNLYLGASFVAGKDIPQIGLVCGNQLLTGNDTAILWADDITALYPIDRVWCMVVPPEHNPDPNNPVADLPVLELAYDAAAGRYQASYSGFDHQGTYKAIYYARDNWNSVSLPRQSFVIQSGLEEKAILLAGGPTNSSSWAEINYLAQYDYKVLLSRWFKGTNIYYLSAQTNQDLDFDGQDDVDAPPTLDRLAYAITNWAAQANKLTLFLVGEGTNAAVRVNATNDLAATQLASWINTYQASNGQACVVLEFASAGSFLPGLAGNTNRIVIASAKSGQRIAWTHDGLYTFSKFFMSFVFKGDTIGSGYSKARTSIGDFFDQETQLDDNGDGMSTKQDGALAMRSYIGAAFATGADIPEIGSVISNALLCATNELLLWASGVTSDTAITNVWCVIRAPDYDGVSALPQTNLTWNTASNRYEALYRDFQVPGTYVCTFFAANSTGDVSSPVQAQIARADAYEIDDTTLEASCIDISDTQLHNFHASNDADWISFYAITNEPYTIKVTQLGTNIDCVLDVYFERVDGTLSNLYHRDSGAKGSGVVEVATMNPPPESGLYYVCVSNYDFTCDGPDSEYELLVEVTMGGGFLTVIAADKLDSQHAPAGAYVKVNNINQGSFGGTNTKVLTLSANTYTVEVPCPAGYIPEEDPKLPNQINNLKSTLYGNPKTKQVKDSTWQSVVFQFVPYTRVSSSTAARDVLTGEWLGSVKISFKAASGVINNLVYDAFPRTPYGVAWYTGAGGNFPTNVILPAVNYQMTLTKAGYSNLVRNGAISSPVYGSTTNLGVCWLAPVDANGNGIADSWEVQYFGPGTNVVPGEDTDEDHFTNWQEYRMGTHPRNGESCLKYSQPPARVANGMTLNWPVTSGRAYELQATENMITGSWALLYGPQVATNGQSAMSCTDTDSVQKIHRTYRIDVNLR